jgi:hypothetical protein
MAKFKRAFALNPSPRLEQDALYEVAEKVSFVCPGPIYDAMTDDMSSFTKMVSNSLSDFDPKNDVVVAFGDPVVLAIITSYLADYNYFHLARFSKFKNGYVVFKIDNMWEFEGE